MAVQRFGKQIITPEKTICNKMPFGKLQRIYRRIYIIEKFRVILRHNLKA